MSMFNWGKKMKAHYSSEVMDPSGFVLLADYVPNIVQEIRYFSTYNFVGDRIDGYEEPVAPLAAGEGRVPGSTAFVPSVAGLIIAGEVVRDLIGRG